MSLADVLQALVDTGATREQLVAAVRAEEAARARSQAEAVAERRAKAAERQRAKRVRDAALAAGQGELPLSEIAAIEAPAGEGSDAESRGVTDVTRDSPVLPPSPSPRPPSTTTNLSPVPPIVPQKRGRSRAPAVAPAAFDAAWAAYPHTRGRSSRPKALAAWIRLDAEVQAALPAAVARYRAEGREPRMDCGAKAFELWLADARYLDWIGEGEAAGAVVAPQAAWAGPEGLRRDAVSQAGEAFVRAYLDPSGWRATGEGGGEILARTGTAAERMGRELRALLQRHGVSVRRERVAG